MTWALVSHRSSYVLKFQYVFVDLYAQVLHDASMFLLMVKCCTQVTDLCHAAGIAKRRDSVDTLSCTFIILLNMQDSVDTLSCVFIILLNMSQKHISCGIVKDKLSSHVIIS